MKIREFEIHAYPPRICDVVVTTPLWPAWLFDEYADKAGGYQRRAAAKRYDRCHQQFRDYAKETQATLDQLQLDTGATLVDMGCGTGAFSVNAASRVHTIYAVDVSKVMLRRLKRKARKGGVHNIQCCRGGLLTYAHKADPVDAVVCSLALHHLPDFWKQVALRRMAAILRPQGRLYLHDVVFSGGHTEAAPGTG